MIISIENMYNIFIMDKSSTFQLDYSHSYYIVFFMGLLLF